MSSLCSLKKKYYGHFLDSYTARPSASHAGAQGAATRHIVRYLFIYVHTYVHTCTQSPSLDQQFYFIILSIAVAAFILNSYAPFHLKWNHPLLFKLLGHLLFFTSWKQIQTRKYAIQSGETKRTMHAHTHVHIIFVSWIRRTEPLIE